MTSGHEEPGSQSQEEKAVAPSQGEAARPAKHAGRQSRKSSPVDTDFLPAALEVLESPPSPIGRTIIWLIMAAILSVIIWAAFARVDVVAIADGKVVPRTRLQSVEAPETGIVRQILVREGEFVQRGQELIALDPTFADADAMSAEIEHATADLARARSNALLSFSSGGSAVFKAPVGAAPAAAAAEKAVVQARIQSLNAVLGSIDQRVAGAQASLRSLEAGQRKLLETLPLDEENYGIMTRLAKEGLAPRPQMIEAEKRLVQVRRDIDIQAEQIEETNAEIRSLMRDRDRQIEDFRAQAAAEKAQAEAIVSTRAAGVRKAKLREGYQTLVAPAAGFVNEISVTTIGETAEAGSTLMTIVPEGEELFVDALVLNRDAGFVRVGQQVVVKLDAYPFTRHGYIDGEIESLSRDAIADDARGLVFPARVKLLRSHLREIAPIILTNPSGPTRGDGRATLGSSGTAAESLSPGMSAKVEIITGNRSVLDFALSPIAKAADEAGRER